MAKSKTKVEQRCTHCEGELIPLPWIVKDTDPILVCLVCDQVGEWPSQAKPKPKSKKRSS